MNHFPHQPHPGQPGQKNPALTCADFEARLAELAELPDVVENSFSPEAVAFTEHQAALAEHESTCARCRLLLTQARQGHQWLQLLHEELLEPPASLVTSILARTIRPSAEHRDVAGHPIQAASGLSADDAARAARPFAPRPWKPARFPILLTARRAVSRVVFDPRLSLTAAMAFFSISLTLNLLGVHLNAFRPSNLTEKNLRLTLTRQYVLANSSVVRYYENLRFVYEVESSVQQLRRAAESPDAAPADSSPDSSPDSSGPDSAQPSKAQPSKSKSKNPPGKSGSSHPDQPPAQRPFARIALGPTLLAALAPPPAPPAAWTASPAPLKAAFGLRGIKVLGAPFKPPFGLSGMRISAPSIMFLSKIQSHSEPFGITQGRLREESRQSPLVDDVLLKSQPVPPPGRPVPSERSAV